MWIDVHASLGFWPFQVFPDVPPAVLERRLLAEGVREAWVSPVEAILAPDPACWNRRLFARLKGRSCLRPVGVVNPLLADWRETFATPELRRDCPDAAKFEVVERALEHFRARYAEDPSVDIIDVDGVRLSFADGWALLRASNTQPALVLRFEAESAGRLAAIRALVEEPLAAWIGEAGGK